MKELQRTPTLLVIVITVIITTAIVITVEKIADPRKAEQHENATPKPIRPSVFKIISGPNQIARPGDPKPELPIPADRLVDGRLHMVCREGDLLLTVQINLPTAGTWNAQYKVGETTDKECNRQELDQMVSTLGVILLAELETR